MDKKEVVAYFYETIVSKNLLEELPRYISEQCVLNVGGKTIPFGLSGMKEHLIAVRKTYPDYTIKITRQHTDGDYVISEFIMEGTHQGDFVGITPTNKKLSFAGVDIDKVVNGTIIEHGGAVNSFETFLEHGLIKAV